MINLICVHSVLSCTFTWGCSDIVMVHREEDVVQMSVCMSNILKAWSMKEMSWRRWTESHWSTGSQRKSFLSWLVSPVLFGHIVFFSVVKDKAGCFIFFHIFLLLEASVSLSMPFNFSSKSVALSSNLPPPLLFFFTVKMWNFLKKSHTWTLFLEQNRKKEKRKRKSQLFPEATGHCTV